MFSAAMVSWVLMWTFTIIYIFYECTKVFHMRSKYFKELESWLHLVTFISFPLISFHNNPFNWTSTKVPELRWWQYHINGFAIFCTWVLQMLIVGKIPRFGIYVEIFKKVAKTFINFATAFFFLLVAFTLSFVVLFQEKLAFKYVSVVIKVVVMMLGEIEYDDLFKNNPESDKPENVEFPGTSHIMLGAFILMISMVLMNVLFGLAVADIQVNSFLIKTR